MIPTDAGLSTHRDLRFWERDQAVAGLNGSRQHRRMVRLRAGPAGTGLGWLSGKNAELRWIDRTRSLAAEVYRKKVLRSPVSRSAAPAMANSATVEGSGTTSIEPETSASMVMESPSISERPVASETNDTTVGP